MFRMFQPGGRWTFSCTGKCGKHGDQIDYRIYRCQGGVFYLFDQHTGRRESLETADEAAVWRLLHAKNEAQQQPLINRQIARAYLAVGDPEIIRRTWRNVLAEIIKLKHDATQQRWVIGWLRMMLKRTSAVSSGAVQLLAGVQVPQPGDLFQHGQRRVPHLRGVCVTAKAQSDRRMGIGAGKT
jgi:hypothetical protein